MIHHLSISAKDPEHVAKVLTEIMGGYYRPFHMFPNSFMAFQLDDFGTQIEIYPTGMEIHPTDGSGLTLCPPRNPAYGPTHFALSVQRSPEEVFAIMARENWLCRRNDRAEFPVIEIWIENTTMFEVLPPEFAKKYLEITAETRRQVMADRAAKAAN